MVVTRVEPAREYVYTYPERRVVIERGVLPPDAVIVERSYEVVPTYPIEKPYDYITELNPQTGPHLGMGLFPRTGEGPTDFGG